MPPPQESLERALLRRILEKSDASVLSVAQDGSGVLRLGSIIVLSADDMQLVRNLLA